MSWVTQVTMWTVVILAVTSAGQWVRAKLHERQAAREFARKLDARDDAARTLQGLDDAAFWDALLNAQRRKGERREQR